jgi:hypothetical protein
VRQQAQLSVNNTIDAIKNLCPDDQPVRTQNFNLWPCVCGVPMWQQPCMVCGWWPEGNWSATYREQRRESCVKRVSDARNAFITHCEQNHNIAVWYVSHWRRTAAWKPSASWEKMQPKHYQFRAHIEDLERKAAAIACASPEDIYDITLGQYNAKKAKQRKEQ